MGREQGVTETQLRELSSYETSDAFTDRERLALRYADAMTSTPVDVPADLSTALRESFDPPSLVELTSAIAWENYRARFDHALGLESEGFSEGQFCPLPTR